MKAFEYHEATKHHRDKLSGRRMDRATQPAPFKTYPPDFERISLPRESVFPMMSMPEALTSPEALSQPLTMDRLARVLSLTCGLTASMGRIYLRSNPSAGALYPVETYIAMPGAGDDPGGVFHYDPGDHALTRIRRGDGASYAATTCRLPEGAGEPAAVFLFTSIYHRSAWKYGDRAYRYVLLDTGHVVENLLLACKAENLAAACVTEFVDAAANSLLGVDAEREVCQTMVAVYHGQAPDTAPPAEPRGLEPIEDRQALAEAGLTVANEPEYPTIQAAHAAGNRDKPGEMTPGPVMDAQALGLDVMDTEPLPAAAGLFAGRQMPSLAQCMLSRRSQRSFVPEAPDAQTTQAFLRLICERLDGGCDEPDRTVATAVVKGMGAEAGMYLLNRKAGSLTQVRTRAERYPSGDIRAAITDACLGQGWLMRAAFHVLFLTDVTKLDATLGPRGYRRAELLAGRLGERVYIAANALGMGACGVGAFFDDEIAAALGLGAEGKVIYILAAGPCQRH